MVDSDIIQEIKMAVDSGEKLSAGMRDRLVLAAILQLYRANNDLTAALKEHIGASEAEVKKELGEHDKRIKKLEDHDLISFVQNHPKLTALIIIILFSIWAMRVPILTWLGLPPELIP